MSRRLKRRARYLRKERERKAAREAYHEAHLKAIRRKHPTSTADLVRRHLERLAEMRGDRRE